MLIAGSEATRRALVAQVQELFGKSVELRSYAMDGKGLARTVKDALVVVTSAQILSECRGRLDPSCAVLVARRTLNLAHLDALYPIPESSSLLVVTGSRQTAGEVVTFLKEVGFVKYAFEAYGPDGPAPKGAYDFVITPGVGHLVPSPHVPVIDIGPRLLDITTIVEILNLLGLFDARTEDRAYWVSAKYMEKIIALGKALSGRNEFLLKVFNSVTDGMIAYDPGGKVEFINPKATLLLNLRAGDNLFAELKRHNQEVHRFLLEDAREHFLIQEEHSAYLLSKVFDPANRACLLTIKNVRERINMESQLSSALQKRGFRAKYTFSDLVHCSQVMRDLISKSAKLARCDFNVLIYGESGTGKELLASALHNASNRRNGPYLAVNFSALPDELIESELFGYEEGAFTGARRGGKVGLFELANHGTIFLDEIGDVSPKIQSRLLRVIQEKEILKVGGSKNIPVDVRVIAATNKNLADRVRDGRFREDLYYRVKKLYLHIPPLRARREDILPVFRHFLSTRHGSDLELTEDAQALLQDYDWPGNIRELESNAEYSLAVCEGPRIDRFCLSEDLLKTPPAVSASGSGDVAVLLEAIRRFNQANQVIGRRKLAELSAASPHRLSEDQVRRLLGQLSAQGLVRMGRGRAGVRLTEAGMAACAPPRNGP